MFNVDEVNGYTWDDDTRIISVRKGSCRREQSNTLVHGVIRSRTGVPPEAGVQLNAIRAFVTLSAATSRVGGAGGDRYI